MKVTAGKFVGVLTGFGMLEKETAVAQLNEAMVPKSVAGCNLYAQDDFPLHRTTTQDIVRGSGLLHPLKARVHCRTLEDHATSSIYHCKNAEEMMHVLQDALLAHRRAYQAGILHRDVGDNTVLLVRKADNSVTGVLVDWDAAMENERDCTPDTIPSSPQRQRYRKGTWYFMSSRLLRDAAEAHTLRDDLESFFHLTLYLSISWLPYTGAAATSLHRFVSQVFKEYDFSQYFEEPVGGGGKLLMFYFRRHIGKIEFTSNRPLTIWVNEVFDTFKDSYRTQCNSNLEPHLHNHDFIVEKFTEVLGMDGWSNVKPSVDPKN